MNPNDFYVKNIFEKFGYFATWFPNAKIKLGDIGVLDGFYFKQIGTLEQSNLPFSIREADKAVDFSYSCLANITLNTSEQANTLNNIASAGIKINFTNSGSFIFEASNCIINEIENKLSLGEEIKKLYKNNNWQYDWVIVDTIIISSSSTILVSNTNNSELELTASSDLPKINLTDNSIDLKIKSQKGELTKFIATHGLTPLFKTSKVKNSFLNRLSRRKDNVRFGGSNAERNFQEYTEDDIWERITL